MCGAGRSPGECSFEIDVTFIIIIIQHVIHYTVLPCFHLQLLKYCIRTVYAIKEFVQDG